MSPPSCTQTNIHTFAPHVDTQKWTRYPHSHSPYALYTPRSRHHHPQRGSQRPIPELNPLRSGVGTGRPPRSPQQQRKSTAQTPTGRPALSSSTVVAPPFILPELLRGTRDRWVAQVSLIIINSTGLAPFPRLSAPPHSSQSYLHYICI